MTRFFSLLTIPALALFALAFAADIAHCQDDQGGGSFWGGGFGGGGRGGRRQMQQMGGGEGDDGSGFGGGFGGRGGGRGGRGGGFGGGGGRGGRGGGWGGGSMFPGGGMDGAFDGGMDAGGGGPSGRGQGGASDAAGTSKPSSASDGIPHFGEVVGLSPPPGFGGTLAVSTTVTTIGSTGSSSGGASASAGSPSSDSSAVQVDEKTRTFAQAKMKQFDKNNNGRLEKEEWSAMNDGEKYDLNKDAVVSLDEMVQYLSRPLGSDDTADTPKAVSKSSPSRSPSGRPGHFRSVAERYPDLPAKYFQLDRDGDGQIEMWEYSTNWTEQTVREFQRYDLNGDGVITPEEWLKAEPKGR